MTRLWWENRSKLRTCMRLAFRMECRWRCCWLSAWVCCLKRSMAANNSIRMNSVWFCNRCSAMICHSLCSTSPSTMCPAKRKAKNRFSDICVSSVDCGREYGNNTYIWIIHHVIVVMRKVFFLFRLSRFPSHRFNINEANNNDQNECGHYRNGHDYR